MGEIIRITKDGLLSIAGMLIEDPALDRARIDSAGNLYARMLTEDPALSKVEWGRDGIVRCRAFWEGKLYTPSFPFVRETTLVLNSGENVRSLLFDGVYLYAGLGTTPGKIVKINPITMSRISTLTLNSNQNDVYALAFDGSYLYAGLFTSPGQIVKIDPITMSRIKTLVLSSNESQVLSLASDGVFLYAGLYTSDGKIVKINPVEMTKITTLALNEPNIHALVFDGTYLYATAGAAPGKVIKIDPVQMIRKNTLLLKSEEKSPRALAFANGYLYVGLNRYDTIAKIDYINMIEISSVRISTEISLEELIFDNKYLYAGFYTSPGKIARIDPNTLSIVSTLTLNSGENYVYALAFDGTYLYAGLYMSPGRIIKIRVKA